MIQIIFSFLIFTLLSPVAFAAGANETLFTILRETGFAAVSVGSADVIAVENVYCEEKSSGKAKCTASQDGTMSKISDSRLFLAALRGETPIVAKKIITFKSLECSSRINADSSAFYSCTVTPLD